MDWKNKRAEYDTPKKNADISFICFILKTGNVEDALFDMYDDH